jgi:ribosomal protein L13E
VVRCQTNKYNMRVRAGRGFTLDELKQAGINRKVRKCGLDKLGLVSGMRGVRTRRAR